MKVLIVGLGSIAKKHIEALNSIDEEVFELYALRSQESSPPFGDVTDVYDLEELDFTPDFIIISNPTNQHYDTIAQSLKIGCPLFIEKPSLSSLENSEKLLEEIKTREISTYVACELRYHPSLAYIKDHFHVNSDERINEVNVYCGSYLPDWHPGQDIRERYSANDTMGGGVHLDLIHELDYVYWIWGAPQRTTSLLKSQSHLAISSVDYANYTLEYDGFVVNIILNYYRRDPKRTMEVICDDCTYEINILDNSVRKNNSVIFSSEENNIVKSNHIAQLRYFIDCVKNSIQPMNSFEDSLKVLNICL